MTNLALKNKDLISWPMSSLRQAINALLDDMSPGDMGMPNLRLIESTGPLHSPRLDMVEEGNNIVVTTDLPGMDEKDIEITVHDNILRLTGEKKEEKEEKHKDYYRKERYIGKFERSEALPCEVKSDKATAMFKNGVLKITLPKVEPTQKQVQKINIKNA